MAKTWLLSLDDGCVTASDIQRALDQAGHGAVGIAAGDDVLMAAARTATAAILADGAAHELSNLLVGVLCNAEFLKLELAADPQAAARLDGMCAAAQRAVDLSRHMVVLARGAERERKAISLNDTVEGVLRLQQRAFPGRVRVVGRCEPDLWGVEADAVQMSQVALSLCLNAADATEDEGQITVATRNVEVAADLARAHPDLRPGPHVCLSVSDQGCGMSQEVLGRIFEPFFTAMEEGRGLGLAAARSIVREHGGCITVESREGEGSTFSVFLPRAERREAEAPEELPPTGTETILVVDNENIVLAVTHEMLKRMGYHVIVARSGQEAVDVARRYDGDIHLAILDVNMPGLRAAEACPMLTEARPGLKVILCSGCGRDEAAQALLDAGASAWAQKPFHFAQLGRIVRSVLDGA